MNRRTFCCENVFKNSHALPKTDILEGTGDTQLGNSIRCRVNSSTVCIESCVFTGVDFLHLAFRVCHDYGLALKLHDTVGGLINAGDAVEGCGLTGTVGADKCNDLTGINLQGEIVDRNDTAKLHGHIFKAQNGIFRHCRHLPLFLWVSFFQIALSGP